MKVKKILQSQFSATVRFFFCGFFLLFVFGGNQKGMKEQDESKEQDELMEKEEKIKKMIKKGEDEVKRKRKRVTRNAEGKVSLIRGFQSAKNFNTEELQKVNLNVSSLNCYPATLNAKRFNCFFFSAFYSLSFLIELQIPSHQSIGSVSGDCHHNRELQKTLSLTI